MTDKEKYDFIDHVVHLTIFVEDRLLNEHGGEYSGLEEDGIDSNEYYRIITERVINILKKNNNYMQEEPVKRTPADIEAAMQEVEEKSKAFTEAHKGENADDILAQMRGEEPVSEDLEEEISRCILDEDMNFDSCARHFANWQKEQMMKIAVDGKIYETQARSKLKAATIGKISRLKYRVGDKVKLIILKED